MRLARRFGSLLGIVVAGALGSAVFGQCLPAGPVAPRTLILALDGVPIRSIERARREGAFADWPEPRPLISTFPSVTNVAFTAIFRPFGIARAGGYEVQHFDLERNSVIGGTPFGYRDRLNPWRSAFDVTSRSIGSKVAVYTAPKRSAWKEVKQAENLLLAASEGTILAHAGATDALIHLRGDDAIHRFLMRLDRRLTLLKRKHVQAHGRALRIVLLSDHGNSAQKIRKARGLRRDLRQSGLTVTKRLSRSGQVVAPTFGLVGYGALFLHPEDADAAGRAIVRNPDVEVAAWLAAPHRMRIMSDDGAATVRWYSDGDELRLTYEVRSGDPLGFGDAVRTLRAAGAVDDSGFAPETDWLRATVATEYPDALPRLVRALTGAYVENRATVVFSLKPGVAWGWSTAHLSSRLAGGKLEGTHGGLDRDSSLGFFMADDPALQPDRALQAEEALVGIAELASCQGLAEAQSVDAHASGM